MGPRYCSEPHVLTHVARIGEKWELSFGYECVIFPMVEVTPKMGDVLEIGADSPPGWGVTITHLRLNGGPWIPRSISPRMAALLAEMDLGEEAP